MDTLLRLNCVGADLDRNRQVFPPARPYAQRAPVFFEPVVRKSVYRQFLDRQATARLHSHEDIRLFHPRRPADPSMLLE